MQNISPNLLLLELAYKEANNKYVSSTLLQEYLNLAELDSKNKKKWYKKAIEVAKKHLRNFPLDKNKYLVLVDLGFAYFCLGKLKLASKNFKGALRIIPKHDQLMRKSLILNLQKINLIK